MAINRCQYWNVYEPHACIYWDVGSFSCKYEESKIEDLQSGVSEETSLEELSDVSKEVSNVPTPIHAPYCNYIGTEVACKYYESSSSSRKRFSKKRNRSC